MATEPSPQRAWRAACPNCGAPVEFRSAASAFAVCSFCRSTVVREGDALRRIGQSAELFDDHSPLQLGVAGRYQGRAFTLVGRLQYRYADGTWNEWHALFGGGDDRDGAPKSGWLSEDNGRHVIAFDAPLAGPAPSVASLHAGAPVVVGGQAWTVASVVRATLVAAQGELPKRPAADGAFVVADLRNASGEVATLAYVDPAAPAAPQWSIGRAVGIGELALTGLADASQPGEKTLRARNAACPNCGAALEVTLATTQSIVCRQCNAVVDVSQGVGGDLRHHVQQGHATEPLIPLGRVGALALGGKAALPWQVVGYVERCEVASGAGSGGDGGDDDDGDNAAASQSFWREYLLYHRTEGFAFIVDADDGWSWTAPITGVPSGGGAVVTLDGATYRKRYDYTGIVTYVLGEFYWQVTRHQRTVNTDYQGSGAAAQKRLNREETATAGAAEVVWSLGEALAAETVRQAFRLAPDQAAALQRDAAPTALGGGSRLAKMFFWGFVIVVVLLLFRCGSGGGSRSDCNAVRDTFGAASGEYQNCLDGQRRGGGGYYGGAGGAFGGYSSGGGHK